MSSLSSLPFALALASLSAQAVASPVSPYSLATGVWKPAAGVTWDINLKDEVNIDKDHPSLPNDVAVFDFDLFGNTGQTDDAGSVDRSKMDALHSINKKIICYFSAGSYEPDRPDSDKFKDSDKGKELIGWPGEYWLDLKSENVASIMRNRIAVAAAAGCDAIDPDNVDGYDNENGLGLTKQDSIDFFKKVLVPAAQENGMAVGLKNAAAIIPDVLDLVQFSVNEQCAQYGECDTFTAFIEANKPIFHIEYPNGDKESPLVLSGDQTAKYCIKDDSGTDITALSTVLKIINLNSWVETCDGHVTPASQ